MENAADAIKMAGAVLLFVLALSIIIPFFSQARETTDLILDARDRETTYINGNYYYKATGNERQVGWETILPTVMRAYLENYKIVFVGLSDPIYTIKLDGDIINKYSLDLETNNGTEYENVALANEDQKAEFLCGILYHKYRTNYEDFNKKFNIEIGSRSLSDMLKGKKITEKLGVYYQNDSRLITVTGACSVTGTAISNNLIQSNKTYEVKITGYNNDGYVSAISITYKGK